MTGKRLSCARYGIDDVHTNLAHEMRQQVVDLLGLAVP
jgi:cytochrome c-type biogenesis protein CcmH/NrfF